MGSAPDPAIPGIEGQFSNPGGTVRPLYGERTPVMYHLFENELDAITAFNGHALTWFSLASFFLNIIFGIVIGFAFASPPLSEFGDFCLHKGILICGVIVVICCFGGIWALCSRKSITEKIKKETISKVVTPRA